MKKKGYKTTKRLTDIRTEILIKGWEENKAEITLQEFLEVLNAMPLSLPHLYLLLRKNYNKK